MTTFAAIGIGMALPYLLLSAFPSLVSRVPRAGPGSELVKQIMGLLMLAAGAYFLGTGFAGMLAVPPDPPTQAYWWVVAVFIGTAGAWLFWRTRQSAARPASRILSGALALAILCSALVIGVRFTRTSPIHWVYFTPDRFTTAQRQARVVVLEFTAAWCLNCHALEQAVLYDPRVTALLNSTNVIPIKVDLTGNNLAGNRKLIEAGRRTIPYLVIYSPDGNEIFASDAYTVDQIVGAISKANSTVLAR
jgi:thiol:disulfide interchange protein DsbD